MTETLVRIESVRVPTVRTEHGACKPLADDIETSGLEQPIVLWGDCTLISGRRRLIAYQLLQRDRIPAVFVHTIEEAAKRLLMDAQNARLSRPMTRSDICRLWQVLRRLDAPAAVKRHDAARRLGAELRAQTQAGKRPAGRSQNRSEDYFLSVMCEPFGFSGATARRIETIYEVATGIALAAPDRVTLAKQIMKDFDRGEPIWPGYQKFLDSRTTPKKVLKKAAPPPPPPVEQVPASKQVAAWEKTLPTLEGMVAGLVALGPFAAELGWAEIGPIHARLSVIRREMEKMIRTMKEKNQA